MTNISPNISKAIINLQKCNKDRNMCFNSEKSIKQVFIIKKMQIIESMKNQGKVFP